MRLIHRLTVRVLALFTLATVMSGCVPAWMQSSFEYTRGTQALSEGRFEEAIHHLELAVQLDPNLSRNQNNLAAAYFEVGRFRDGWPHVRKAVVISPRDQYAAQNFFRYFSAMRELTALANGDTLEEVRSKLGDPDDVNSASGRLMWRYGLTALEFRDSKLIGAADMIVQ